MEKTENIRVPWSGWKVVRLIGRGGYGSVYEISRDAYGISEVSAMKIISIPKDSAAVQDDLSRGYDRESIMKKYEESRDDVLKEYQLMKQFQGNSNIVDCQDFFCEEKKGEIGWNIYIRMEMLQPLLKWMRPEGMQEAEILCLAKDICRALTICERKKIIHRDIKPENIMVSSSGFKLGDFGIAKTLDHTAYGTLAGTWQYMAPEIVRQEPYGPEVDLYSLGMVLYWLLNNRKGPFLPQGNHAEKISELNEALSRRLHGESLPEPVNGSPAFRNIVMKACAYDRKKRYTSARQMMEDLERITPVDPAQNRKNNDGSDNQWKEQSAGKFSGDNHPGQGESSMADSSTVKLSEGESSMADSSTVKLSEGDFYTKKANGNEANYTTQYASSSPSSDSIGQKKPGWNQAEAERDPENEENKRNVTDHVPLSKVSSQNKKGTNGNRSKAGKTRKLHLYDYMIVIWISVYNIVAATVYTYLDYKNNNLSSNGLLAVEILVALLMLLFPCFVFLLKKHWPSVISGYLWSVISFAMIMIGPVGEFSEQNGLILGVISILYIVIIIRSGIAAGLIADHLRDRRQ